MTEYTDRIVQILSECPYGLTAHEVAERLGISSRNMSSRLSKLAAYGIIKKTRGRIVAAGTITGIYSVPTKSVGSNKSAKSTG